MSSEPRKSASMAVAAQSGTLAFERERVSEIQRMRLLSAAGQVCCEHGVANVTVALIVERAGVSRRTFYELYRDSEECLLATFGDALECARERVLEAWFADGDWCERTRASLVALLGLFDDDPALAQLLVVESLAAGHRVLADRARVLGTLIDALANGARRDAPGGTGRAHKASKAAIRLNVEGALGGVLGVLHARISQRSPGRLTELTSPLVSMLVLPCGGLAAAQREARRPAPAPDSPQSRSQTPANQADPFKEAGMRLTYRTMRVLCAIGERPGSSNRKIAALAEIGDQGQISKLLSRLERIGTIANAAVGANKGEANAWTLTPTGRQVISRVNFQTPQDRTPIR